MPVVFYRKRRLEKAIASVGQDTAISVYWLPYQLNPGMPPGGIGRKEYRIQKFGSWERSQELDANVVANGKAEGINFRFDLIERTPNTVDAHRLVWLAGQQGCQDAVVETLFLAYFTNGQDLSERSILLDVVEQAGLGRPLAEELLAGRDGLREIDEAKHLATDVGVDGVPFFIVNRRIGLAGAQPPATFQEAFEQLKHSSS